MTNLPIDAETPSIGDYLDHLCNLARRYALRASTQKNSCILSVKFLLTLIELERDLTDLTLTPIPVRLTAINSVYRDRVEADLPPPTKEEVTLLRQQGAYILMTTDEAAPGIFAGHLVLGVSTPSGECWIVDPSLDQASRPIYGMYLCPVVFQVDGPLNDWREDHLDIEGSLVAYERLDLPSDAWESSPDWSVQIQIQIAQ